MTVGHAETVAAWREVLGLCWLHSDETVAILTKPEANPRNVEAARHAVIDAGAQHFVLEPHLGRTPLMANRPAMDALRAVGLVIDFVGIHLLRAGEQEAITKSGTRILYVVEPPRCRRALDFGRPPGDHEGIGFVEELERPAHRFGHEQRDQR